jgi:uncharacterized protein with LGFP repeats
MPFRRDHRLAFLGVAATAAALLLAGLTDASATSAGMRTAAHARVRLTPHPVAPRVVAAAIPAVSAGAAGSLRRTLRGDRLPSTAGRLAAHVVRTGLVSFEMAGVTWNAGQPAAGIRVLARTRSRGGWSAWSALEYDPTEGPTRRQESTARPGTAPLWTPAATGIEVAVSTATGRAPRGLSVSTIDPGGSAYDANAVAATSVTAAGASALSPGRALTRDGFPEMPVIITRAQWGADPQLTDTCWDPVYGDSLKMVFIHHTVTSNTYTAAEAPSIMRGMLAYHTQSRGWCDIGYNFVVDKFGNIYEGRRGGIRKPVRGAHTGLYNTDSTGISMMGDYDTAPLSLPLRRALVRLVGWRLGTAYENGRGTETLVGKTFQRISGHRDAMATACPGRYGYAWLPTLRKDVDWYLALMKTSIRSAYEAGGGIAHSRLGRVFVGEMGVLTGHRTVFQHGRMYFSATTGRPVATLMVGPVLTRYTAGSGLMPLIGYPKSSDIEYHAHTVEEVRFERGNIYWSAATGARVVDGPILPKYYELKSFVGRLGLPTSDATATSTTVSENFANGSIVYTIATKTYTVTYLT